MRARCIRGLLRGCRGRLQAAQGRLKPALRQRNR
jgi:hypothetical protein